MSALLERFIEKSTVITPVALVPELRLHLARDSIGIFQRAAELDITGERFQPFWAFAWPGGQALARYLLDQPEIAAGKRVVDIGAGSGFAAIAAMKAGARHVLAADIDPMSELAIRANARANNVAVDTTTRDILGDILDADLVVIADLVYEPALATRVTAFLEAARAAGTEVLVADRTTARKPPIAMSVVAEYSAPLTPDMHDLNLDRARLWRLEPPRTRRKRTP